MATHLCCDVHRKANFESDLNHPTEAENAVDADAVDVGGFYKPLLDCTSPFRSVPCVYSCIKN